MDTKFFEALNNNDVSVTRPMIARPHMLAWLDDVSNRLNTGPNWLADRRMADAVYAVLKQTPPPLEVDQKVDGKKRKLAHMEAGTCPKKVKREATSPLFRHVIYQMAETSFFGRFASTPTNAEIAWIGEETWGCTNAKECVVGLVKYGDTPPSLAVMTFNGHGSTKDQSPCFKARDDFKKFAEAHTVQTFASVFLDEACELNQYADFVKAKSLLLAVQMKLVMGIQDAINQAQMRQVESLCRATAETLREKCVRVSK